MSDSLSVQILKLVFEMRNMISLPSGETETSSTAKQNKALQLAKIEDFINSKLPVHMILPAFPAKSPNPQKTVSHRPDYGEVLALGRLNDLCQRISQIYSPGAHIAICSDGRVFSDVVGVCDSAVDVYGRDIKDIIAHHGLKNLSTFSLDEVFSAHNYEAMRNRLLSEFAESLETVRARVQQGR